MKDRNSHFPYHLFRWFLTRQIFLGLLFIFLFNGILLGWIEWRADLDPELRHMGYQLLAVGVLGSTCIMIALSFFMARRLVNPLGQLISKTRRLKEFPFEGEGHLELEMSLDAPGEWYELERSLNQLGQVLRQKTVRLSREKTELRAIMAAVSEAVLAIDKEQKVLFFNPQFALMFEEAKLRETMTISEVLRTPDVITAYSECLQTGQPIKRDVDLSEGLETSRTYQLSVAPLLKKHNQELYGAVGIFHDISELKKLERIRIEFVGNVSHELRTPLTTIHGYLQTLVQDFGKGRLEQAGEFLNIISQNVVRLKSLVEDLLDLSSLESGQALELELIDTKALTEAVVAQVNNRDHLIKLHFSVESVEADSKRVEQVLRNLLENAVRYVPKQGQIDVTWQKGPNNSTQLIVKDNGPGIAKQHQARLFERFFRVDESRARTDGGTGIGLSLAKHIMQRHSGNIAVRSEVGQGAEFVCTFPEVKN